MIKKSNLIFLVVLFLNLISFASVSALSVDVHVPEKYIEVQAGERLYFEVSVKYPENPIRKDLVIKYEIFDNNNNLIAQSKVLKAVETQASFIDFLVIPDSTKKGLYTIKVGIEDSNISGNEVEASFNVVSQSDDLRTYFFILLGGIILVGILLIFSLFGKNKNWKKK